MRSGTIRGHHVGGEIDLGKTLESGQTFLWQRESDQGYGTSEYSGWYWSAVSSDAAEPTVIRVRQTGSDIEWRSNNGTETDVRRRLGLDVEMNRVRDELVDSAPNDSLLREALDACTGLRLVSEPCFPTLISFICSPQMRVERIHRMQGELSSRFGGTVSFSGREYDVYPTPERLASASEDELKQAGLGYRASYVSRTAEMVDEDIDSLRSTADVPYSEARTRLKRYVGVGDKVADCVLLYGLNHRVAVPIDTWVKTAVEEYYPELMGQSYSKTSQNLRDHWGEYAGYAQLYVFHHLRSGDN